MCIPLYLVGLVDFLLGEFAGKVYGFTVAHSSVFFGTLVVELFFLTHVFEDEGVSDVAHNFEVNITSKIATMTKKITGAAIKVSNAISKTIKKLIPNQLSLAQVCRE